MNNRPLLLALLAAIASALGGCVTVYEPLPERPDRSYAAITSHSDQFMPQPGQCFSWFTPGVVLSADDGGTEITAATSQLIVQALEQGLGAKGYRLKADAQGADFLVGAGVLNTDAKQTGPMPDFVKLFPAIRETLDSTQPTSLLVAAGQPANIDKHHLMWRGAVNASIAKDMTEADRQKLIRDIVDSLLEQFP